MIRKIRLKWQLGAIFLAFGACLVVGYSLLAAHYFMLGMDSTMVGALERAAQDYEMQQANGVTDPDVGAFTITPTWQAQPNEVRQLLPEPQTAGGTLLKGRVEEVDGRPGQLYFAMRFSADNGDLFVSHTISRKQMSELVTRIIRDNLNTLLIISIGSAIALAAAIWLVMRQVAKPVTRLGQWAKDLETGNLDAPLPDFRYPELNELARLVRSSLSSLEDGLEREHRFLRHTSHELRTPISVIRSNVELIRSLPPEQAPEADSIMASIIDRVDRASLTMKHLTETLLWLSREETANLPTRQILLDQLVQDLVSEHRYLLKSKEVALTVDTSPATVELADIAARVVIGNLIRNAFQHTWAGDVSIRQSGHTVIINNKQANGEGADDLGFGLGLQLTAQLTERMGWTYHNEPVPGGRSVSLQFNNAASSCT